MTKELATLLGEFMMLKAQHPTLAAKITFDDGKIILEVEPMVQPFTVKDDGVHMYPAPIDYEALGRDAVKLSVWAGKDARPCKMSTFFDPRKHLGDTLDQAAKSWREDIASASSEKAENLKVDVDSIKVEGALTPDDVAQAYLETIGEAVGPSSSVAININTLNVNVG